MSKLPVIGVTADVKEIDGYRWHAVPDPYLRAVTTAGIGVPLIVPAMADAIDAYTLVESLDGVLLTGSRSNVHPDRYGGMVTPEAEPYDTDRDAANFALIEAALDKGVPLFAICRGVQELNVALGGTLFHDLAAQPGRMNHRAPEAEKQAERFAIRQEVDVLPDSELARIVGPGPLHVNSLHRQGIATPAPALSVEAVAPDGTIEAVRVNGAKGFAIGVQWHPEYWVGSDKPSAKLFEAFGAAAKARAAARTKG